MIFFSGNTTEMSMMGARTTARLHVANNTTWAFADHDPTSHNDIVGHKKAVVRLYSSLLDPTVAHVNGVEGMGYMKVVVNYNYFLVPVLKDVAKKHLAIACKFIYLE